MHRAGFYGLQPGVLGFVRASFEVMKNGARPSKLLSALTDSTPILLIAPLAKIFERVELAFPFQLNFKVRNIVVLCLVTLPKQHAVHALSDPFCICLHGEVYLYIEHKDFTRDAGVEKFYKVGDVLLSNLGKE